MNKDERSKYNHEYYLLHRAERQEYHSNYYKNNRKKILTYLKADRKNNPEKYRRKRPKKIQKSEKPIKTMYLKPPEKFCLKCEIRLDSYYAGDNNGIMCQECLEKSKILC